MILAKAALTFEAYHVLPDSPQMQKDFLYVLASLMACSSQRFAEDVLRIAKLNNILPVRVEGFQEFPGRGLGGLVTLPNELRPRAVLIGAYEFIEESGLQMPDILEVAHRRWSREPQSKVLVAGWDAWVRAVLKFNEQPV